MPQKTTPWEDFKWLGGKLMQGAKKIDEKLKKRAAQQREEEKHKLRELERQRGMTRRLSVGQLGRRR